MVLELLRGEDLGALSGQCALTAATLLSWRARVLAAWGRPRSTFYARRKQAWQFRNLEELRQALFEFQAQYNHS